MIPGIITQDTSKSKFVFKINTQDLLHDSVFKHMETMPDSELVLRSSKKKIAGPPVNTKKITDTINITYRSAVEDVNPSDSGNFILNLNTYAPVDVPIPPVTQYSENNRLPVTYISKNLKEGQLIPRKPLQGDWVLAVIVIITIMFISIKKTSVFLHETSQFFFFRGINDPASRDTNYLFYPESMMMNLISFINIGLFLFCAASLDNLIPQGMSPVLFLLIASSIIASGAVVRHFICSVTGELSGESDIFNEYLLTVYKFYSFFAVSSFVLVVLIIYTTSFKPQVYLTVGFIILILLYIIRITRLILIFIRNNVSIFYLILYLCALEFLPVLIGLKFFAGLIK